MNLKDIIRRMKLEKLPREFIQTAREAVESGDLAVEALMHAWACEKCCDEQEKIIEDIEHHLQNGCPLSSPLPEEEELPTTVETVPIGDQIDDVISETEDLIDSLKSED